MEDSSQKQQRLTLRHQWNSSGTVDNDATTRHQHHPLDEFDVHYAQTVEREDDFEGDDDKNAAAGGGGGRPSKKRSRKEEVLPMGQQVQDKESSCDHHFRTLCQALSLHYCPVCQQEGSFWLYDATTHEVRCHFSSYSSSSLFENSSGRCPMRVKVTRNGHSFEDCVRKVCLIVQEHQECRKNIERKKNTGGSEGGGELSHLCFSVSGGASSFVGGPQTRDPVKGIALELGLDLDSRHLDRYVGGGGFSFEGDDEAPPSLSATSSPAVGGGSHGTRVESSPSLNVDRDTLMQHLLKKIEEDDHDPPSQQEVADLLSEQKTLLNNYREGDPAKGSGVSGGEQFLFVTCSCMGREGAAQLVF